MNTSDPNNRLFAPPVQSLGIWAFMPVALPLYWFEFQLYLLGMAVRGRV